jgi:CelD/BcsL family acetyltransferase involved in cellulose biosynthesis
MPQSSLIKIESKTINLFTGSKALSLLSEAQFSKEWDDLYKSCKWATVYQAKEFVLTWYEIYCNRYLPVIVTEINEGRLTSLLALAKDENGLIVGAGASQAEYQVWMCSHDNGRFIKTALQKVKKQFPGSDIQLKFIPSETPLQWVESGRRFAMRPKLRMYHQPLMTIDENISAELKKKNRRKKINGLRGLGDLKFERITDKKTFCSIFDELASQYDFRKGAMYNKTPFQKDPHKKNFLLSLFDQNILHVTVLKCNNEIIASNVAAIGKNWMHLQGMNTHSPSYAKYSPGILHFLFLGNSLIDEGFEMLDLTPGENSYKEHLATKHVSTYELLIPGSIKFYIKEFKQKMFYRLLINKQKILGILIKIGINSKDIKTTLRKVSIRKEKIKSAKRQGFISLIVLLLNGISVQSKNKIFKIDHCTINRTTPVSKNDLGHILSYRSDNSKITRWEFLADAMQKMEREQEVYSSAEDNTLMNCVWVSKKKCENVNAICKLKDAVPTESTILYDFYCHPFAQKNLTTFIATVSAEILKTGNNSVYAIACKRDKNLLTALKETGFKDLADEDIQAEEYETIALNPDLIYVRSK